MNLTKPDGSNFLKHGLEISYGHALLARCKIEPHKIGASTLGRIELIVGGEVIIGRTPARDERYEREMSAYIGNKNAVIVRDIGDCSPLPLVSYIGERVVCSNMRVASKALKRPYVTKHGFQIKVSDQMLQQVVFEPVRTLTGSSTSTVKKRKMGFVHLGKTAGTAITCAFTSQVQQSESGGWDARKTCPGSPEDTAISRQVVDRFHLVPTPLRFVLDYIEKSCRANDILVLQTQVLQDGCNGAALFPAVVAGNTVCQGPTVAPSVVPISSPTGTLAPSVVPSSSPTGTPTVAPSVVPSVVPSSSPTVAPSVVPSSSPTVAPSVVPSSSPTVAPSVVPSSSPTGKKGGKGRASKKERKPKGIKSSSSSSPTGKKGGKGRASDKETSPKASKNSSSSSAASPGKGGRYLTTRRQQSKDTDK